MTTLSIKDVPESWAEALRQRATQNHRSLQGELMALVEQAVHESAAPYAPTTAATPQAGERARPRVVGYDKRGWPVVRQGWKPPEQVIAELRAKYPKPVRGQPLAVDILRQERDSR
jgi:plasmid stability protein